MKINEYPDSSKRIMHRLEINVIYACNLKCEYCTHLGKYLEGYVPLNEIISWYETWHQKVHPRQFTILGGEPLLHPDLEKVLYATREFWDGSEIQMVTNGLLIPHVSRHIWEALRRTNIKVIVSRHFMSKKYSQQLEKSIRLLEEQQIRYGDRASFTWWMKSYRLEESGKILPYSSDPETAWENCYVKHKCMTLMNNRIYKCPQLACFTHAYQNGFLGEEWEFLLDYSPLTPGASEEEFTEFLRESPVSQCRLCPEVFEYVTENEKKV